MGAPSRTFCALQQKPYGPNLVILIFCRIPIGIRIGLKRWLNQLVPGYEHSPTRFSHGTIWLEAQSFDQTIFHSQLQGRSGSLVLMGASCLRIVWCVEFAGMFDSLQCLPY